MVKDLTEGKPEAMLWRFSLPMFVSVIFQQFYNIADSMIAGKFAGEDALAAVGASYPITMIFMAIAVGSNIGCSVVISQFFGAKAYQKVKTCISTTLIASYALSIILTITGLLGSKWLMEMLNTPANVFKEGALYLRIYIAGFSFLFLYNVATGIFNSLGDSKTPLYFLMGSSVGNIILDCIFVIVFGWGVAGVAWATFIAQGVSCILALFALRARINAIKINEQVEHFSWEMLGKTSLIAIPSILQQSFVSVGNIFIQWLINSYGSSVIAGYSAAIKLNTFAITSLTTLGNGLSSFTAQNVGAGKIERVRSGFKAGLVMILCVAAPFIVLYFGFSSQMVALFMKDESKMAIATGVSFLKMVSPFYVVIGIKLMADGVLRGGGAMKAFMFSTFSDLILRVILSFSLSPHFGTQGIWMSWPIGWSVAMTLSLGFYLKGAWKNKSIAQI